MIKVRLQLSDRRFHELLCRELERDADIVLLLEPSSRYDIAADILVLEVGASADSAGDSIQIAKREHPKARVVVVTIPSHDAVQAALSAGAAGVVARSQPIREIVGAIRVVADSGSYVCGIG